MDCRPRLTSSIYPWFRIRVYLLLDGRPTKAVELHLPGFGIRSCPSPRLCRSTAPYSVLFWSNPPKGGLPHPPPRGHAPMPYSPSAGPTNVAKVQFWHGAICGLTLLLVLTLLQGFSFGFSSFPLSTKSNILKFQFDKDLHEKQLRLMWPPLNIVVYLYFILFLDAS